MRRLLLFAALMLASAPAPMARARSAFACAPGGPASSLPFCRRSLPLRARARDFVSRLTRAEKVRLLVNNAAGVPRLGVAGYEWLSGALHGVSVRGPGVRFGGAFPQVIGTAAALNASLWELIGRETNDSGVLLLMVGILRTLLRWWSSWSIGEWSGSGGLVSSLMVVVVLLMLMMLVSNALLGFSFYSLRRAFGRLLNYLSLLLPG